MANKKETKPKYMEVDVPEQVMTEVAEIIAESDIDASILGIGDEPESIVIGFDYPPEERENMMEILELIEECNEDEEEDQEED